MGYDLILLLLGSIYIEKLFLKEKYILLSPFFIFHISFLYTYIMPLILYGERDSQNYLNRLSDDYVSELLLYCRIFYYIFFVLQFFVFLNLKKKGYRYICTDFEINPRLFIYMYIMLLTGGILIDLYRVNFNIINYFLLMIDPRSFTYLREGLGPFTILNTFVRLVLVYISFIYFFSKKTWKRLFYLLTACFFCVLGGSKSSLIFVVIFGILLYQKYSKKVLSISFYSIIKVCIFVSFALLFSFYIMSGSIQLLSLKDVINFIVSYSQEAFYSTLVINDFNYSFDHIVLLIKGFLLTPIPRTLYSEKEFYSFYNVYWHDAYQPNSPIFNTSTYGFLAEGHMLLGFLCPIVYPILIIYVLRKIYVLFLMNNDFITTFMMTYLVSRIYFFTRTNFFDPTNIWTIIVYYLFLQIIFKFVKRIK